MDRELALEALSALTLVFSKPLPEGRSGAAAVSLTTETLLSTVFDETLRSQMLCPIGLVLTHPSSSKRSTTSISALRTEQFVDVKNFFDPEYDYDFRRGSDASECSRGGEPYSRPWGWYRFALKVRDKYSDGNDWLGSGGWRDESSPGEWPVSFHGTSIEGAKGIVETHFKPLGKHGEVYGRGIYSTPDINEAERYTQMFISQKNGKTYKVIMQNRINPEKRKITTRKDYWLVQIPEETSRDEARKIVTESIRPYGILIKETSDN